MIRALAVLVVSGFILAACGSTTTGPTSPPIISETPSTEPPSAEPTIDAEAVQREVAKHMADARDDLLVISEDLSEGELLLGFSQMLALAESEQSWLAGQEPVECLRNALRSWSGSMRATQELSDGALTALQNNDAASMAAIADQAFEVGAAVSTAASEAAAADCST